MAQQLQRLVPVVAQLKTYRPISSSKDGLKYYTVRRVKFLVGRDFASPRASMWRDLARPSRQIYLDFYNTAEILAGLKPACVSQQTRSISNTGQRVRIRVETLFAGAGFGQDGGPARDTQYIPCGYALSLESTMGPKPELLIAAQDVARAIASGRVVRAAHTAKPPRAAKPIAKDDDEEEEEEEEEEEDSESESASDLVDSDDDSASTTTKKKKKRGKAEPKKTKKKKKKSNADKGSRASRELARIMAPIDEPLPKALQPREERGKKRARSVDGEDEPPKKRRRLESAADDDAQPSAAAEGEVEAAAAADDDVPEVEQWLADLVQIKQAEAQWVSSTRLAIKGAKILENLDKTLPENYIYLYDGVDARALDNVFRKPYYTDGECTAMGEADERGYAAMRLDSDQPLETYARALNRAFTMADSFTFRTKGVDWDTSDPCLYYSAASPIGARLREAQSSKRLNFHFAVDETTFFKQLLEAAPALGRVGCPAPDTYPHPKFVFDVQTYWALPELMLEQPLPYPLGTPIPAPQEAGYFYERDQARFVREHTDTIFRPILDAAHEESDVYSSMAVSHYVDNPIGRDAMLNDLHATAEDVAQFTTSFDSNANRREPQHVPRPALDEENVQRLVGVLTRVAENYETMQHEVRRMYMGLPGFPRWLTIASETALADPSRRMRQRNISNIEILNAPRAITSEGTDGSELHTAPRIQSDEDINRRYAENHPEDTVAPHMTAGRLEDDMISHIARTSAAISASRAATSEIDPALRPLDEADKRHPIWRHPNQDEQTGRMASEALLEQALHIKNQAGSWNVSEVLLRQKADVMRLRTKHEGEKAELETKLSTNRHLSEYDKNERRRSMQEIQGKETLTVFWNTMNETGDFIAQRTALKSLKRLNGGSLAIPVQPIVNGSIFQTMMIWQQSLIAVPFKVAPRTMHLTNLLIETVASRHVLPKLTEGRPMANPVVYGDAMTSKSFAAWIAHATALPGGVSIETYFSPKWATAGEHIGWVVYLFHEGTEGMLCNPGDRNNPRGLGDAQQCAMIKTGMTDYVINATILAIDEKTKKRSRMITTTFMHVNWIVLMNAGIESIHKPILTRMIPIETRMPNNEEPSDDVSNYMRRDDRTAGRQFFDLIKQQNCHDGQNMIITHVCNAGVFTNETQDDQAIDVINRILDHLQSYCVRRSGFTPRRRQLVGTFSQTLCRKEVAFALIATPIGHKWMADRQLSAGGDVTKPLDSTCWDAIRDFCAPRLHVTLEHVVYSLTMLDFLFEPLYEAELLTVWVNYLLKSRDGQARNIPIRTLLADIEGRQDLFMDMGFQPVKPPEPPQVPQVDASSKNGKKPTPQAADQPPIPDQGGDQPAPTLPLPQVNDAQSTATGQPDPAADAVAASKKGRPPAQQSYAGPPAAEYDDYRFLTLVIKSKSQFASTIEGEQGREVGYKTRSMDTERMLRELEEERIDAPFIERSADGKLSYKKNKNGKIITDSIHCLVRRRLPPSKAHVVGMGTRRSRKNGNGYKETEEEQLGISIEYLRRRIGLACLVEGDVERTLNEVASAASDVDRETIKKHLEKTPQQRLTTPVYLESDLIMPSAKNLVVGKAERERIKQKQIALVEDMATCDVSRRSMGRAISAVLGHPYFRRTDLTDDLLDPPEARFLVAYPPRNFRVELDLTTAPNEIAPTIPVNCGPFHQLLTVRRSKGATNSIVLKQFARARHTQAIQLSAAMCTPTTSSTMAALRVVAERYEFCTDFEAAIQRFDDLGRPHSPYFEAQANIASPKDTRVPWFYAPRFNKLAVAMAIAAKIPVVADYPQTDILQEVAELARLRHEELGRRDPDLPPMIRPYHERRARVNPYADQVLGYQPPPVPGRQELPIVIRDGAPRSADEIQRDLLQHQRTQAVVPTDIMGVGDIV